MVRIRLQCPNSGQNTTWIIHINLWCSIANILPGISFENPHMQCVPVDIYWCALPIHRIQVGRYIIYRTTVCTLVLSGIYLRDMDITSGIIVENNGNGALPRLLLNIEFTWIFKICKHRFTECVCAIHVTRAGLRSQTICINSILEENVCLLSTNYKYIDIHQFIYFPNIMIRTSVVYKFVMTILYMTFSDMSNILIRVNKNIVRNNNISKLFMWTTYNKVVYLVYWFSMVIALLK